MVLESENPGAGGAARGACNVGSPKQLNTGKLSQPKPLLKVKRASDNAMMTFSGREAQTLDLLIQCGAKGLTSGEASPFGWARRTSAYIKKLRVGGVNITTTREPASDAVIGRYRLSDSLTVVASHGL